MVRIRLLVLALLPLVVLMPLLLGLTMLRWIDKFDELLIAKVASDLRIAEQYFGRIEASQAGDVAALAQSVRFAEARAQGAQALASFLDAERVELGLDFLIYGGAGARALPAPARDVARSALPDEPSAGLALFDAEELAAISPALATLARLPLVPTEAARPIQRTAETRGMVILAAHRLPASEGVLLGGRLLNQNLDVIDTMNDLIYRDAADGLVRTGTTTLFLDDVRISTNVRLFEGSRALGTRVPEVVWRQVMEDGQPWLDRAFVVNDWYVSGYVPLSDMAGNRIGMLYTGFLEAPFTSQRNTTILILILAFAAVILFTVPLFLRMAQGIFAPLEQMTAAMGRVQAGELDARIGPVTAKDEIGAVARHLDSLLDQVEERDAALRDYAGNLNELVEQRTSELQEANRKLEATFAQLVMSEKLATVGEITAGVAHEINNPVAVIQGNLEIIRASLDADTAAELEMQIDLIDAQTHRINIIVGKLLNFTRPGDMSDVATQLDVRDAVDDALVLVAADIRKNCIETEVVHAEAPRVRAVETELQQVLVNLVINAMQAMGSDGKITIQTGAASREDVSGAEIRISDTGPGIAPEKLDTVFDPFFTTKPGQGSGLGLSISQALIARVGGFISVSNNSDRGATFCVWFPAADNSTADLSVAAQ